MFDSVVGCPTSGVVTRLKDRDTLRLVDLTMAGRKIARVWHKRRFVCLEPECDMKSCTQLDPRIGAPRMRMSNRCARCVTLKVGSDGLEVSALAQELGCDWHTVNDAVLS